MCVVEKVKERLTIFGGSSTELRQHAGEAQVISGVSQSSVLGLLLFQIHISGINYEIADSTVSCFTDDTRILLGKKDGGHTDATKLFT